MLGENAMSDDSTTRRSIVKKMGAAAVGLAAGATGSAAASSDDSPSVSPEDTKQHYIRFQIDKNEGAPAYNLTVPDPNPNLVSVEDCYLNCNDQVTYYDDRTVIDGNLNGANSPFYDEVEFDGSLDSADFEWTADAEIEVTLDGDVVQNG